MQTMNRRQFVRSGASAAAGLGVAPLFTAAPAGAQDRIADDDRVVRLSGDGLGLTPRQYARLLAQLAEQRNIGVDNYSIGGVVDELEQRFAQLLGKERAVFMPTGTLANSIAVRALAGGPSRVIVQEESHLYQDEGDCAQTLSALTLMPLAAGRATFTADELQRVIDQTRTGRVPPRVSAISIETPVRRRQGEAFDAGQLRAITAIARRDGIRMHLDAARLFLQAAYTGESIVETCDPFDTVYVSLYKYFNAASGAILAGPRALLDPIFNTRRMFGGGLPQVWPFAAVALHYLDGFGERYARAVRASEDLIAALQRHGAFTIERVPRGTNIVRLQVRTPDAAAFQRRAATAGVVLAAPQGDTFTVGVNETLNRLPAADVATALIRAL